MRPLSQTLKMSSPLLLAREAAWRIRKKWEKKRILAELEERTCRVEFRNIPYYKPAITSLNGTTQELLLAFANHVCEGRFPFLGYGTVDLGQRPRWNVDFICGSDWPLIPLENRDYVRLDGSDVKVPFELSRLQFLPILGKAHVLSGEARYREAAKDLLAQWIQSNPVRMGVNWTIAMEAALRAMSICFLLNLLSPFGPEEQHWLATVTRSLVQHALYIEANIEFSHLSTSNHYLSDVVGLYCLSVFLAGEGMAAKRREYRRRIEAEMAKQVYEDGGDYEASTGYQVLVTQLFTTALLLMRSDGSAPASPAFVERLRMMFRFLNTVASRSGELPQVGDCDDGRTELLIDDLRQMIHSPVSERNSLRVPQLLGLGQRLFGEGAGAGDDAAWYGLTDATPIHNSESQMHPGSAYAIRVLPKSGIGVLQNVSAELLFFAIPNGIFGKGSHTHNDKLSFVLRLGGREVVCDSGTGCYTRDIATRNRFRSTTAHNTLLIDGVEQNRIFPGPIGLFALGDEAAVSRIQEGRDALGGFMRASHTGYSSIGVLHTRTIRVVDCEKAFVIEDQLDGHGVHDFELNLQLTPNLSAEVHAAKDGILCRILGDRQVQLTVDGPPGLQGSIEPSLVSTIYGSTVPASRLRFRGRATIPARITTRISWVDIAASTMGQTSSARESKIRDVVATGVCQS
jgi:Heparinase II/III-like protein/Heparinase II/III N-terminus